MNDKLPTYSTDYFAARKIEIIRMRASGMTLNRIGLIFDITKERVRQIILKDAPRSVVQSLRRRSG